VRRAGVEIAGHYARRAGGGIALVSYTQSQRAGRPSLVAVPQYLTDGAINVLVKSCLRLCRSQLWNHVGSGTV